MFADRGGALDVSVEGVEWDICVSAHLSLRQVLIEEAECFCRGGVFFEQLSSFEVQRVFCRSSTRKLGLAGKFPGPVRAYPLRRYDLEKALLSPSAGPEGIMNFSSSLAEDLLGREA
ncbi:hypothetical protein TNCV_2130111 [Trichonephila clavipes]|nr:hypothetical protein TNCV_2130111 [Trichonephila clavipes]